jgi:hypothetical protein
MLIYQNVLLSTQWSTIELFLNSNMAPHGQLFPNLNLKSEYFLLAHGLVDWEGLVPRMSVRFILIKYIPFANKIISFDKLSYKKSKEHISFNNFILN